MAQTLASQAGEKRLADALEKVSTMEGKGSSTSDAWLIIGIPSVPRAGKDYLNPTLSSIFDQLPDDPRDPFYGAVRVVVMNMRPAEAHVAFSSARKTYSSTAKGKDHFVFVDNNHPVPDPSPSTKDRGTKDRPGWHVRRQTRDIASLLKHTAVAGKSAFYLFSEDDMRLCPHGIAIRYLIAKSSARRSDWFTVFHMA